MARAVHRTRRADPAQLLGARVLGFARSHQGSQVGDGECSTLVQQALLSAGARTADAYGEVTPDADYVWGTPVQLSAVRPGDVLQFRNYHITRRIITAQRLADGEVSRSESEEYEERDHHSAIVEQNAGGMLSVLEQNVDPDGRVVQRHRLEMSGGTYTETNREDGSLVTTVVSVEGQVFAYRPQKASPREMAAAQSASAGDGYSSDRR